MWARREAVRARRTPCTWGAIVGCRTGGCRRAAAGFSVRLRRGAGRGLVVVTADGFSGGHWRQLHRRRRQRHRRHLQADELSVLDAGKDPCGASERDAAAGGQGGAVSRPTAARYRSSAPDCTLCSPESAPAGGSAIARGTRRRGSTQQRPNVEYRRWQLVGDCTALR
jgi:hypothetical protein